MYFKNKYYKQTETGDSNWLAQSLMVSTRVIQSMGRSHYCAVNHYNQLLRSPEGPDPLKAVSRMSPR